MKMIITIEINPYDFAKNEYESPMLSLEENPDIWNTFWLKSISDSGLQNLKAIQKGSYLVDITSIQEDEWEIILQQHLEEVEWEWYEDQIEKLSGGIALKADDSFRIVPQCCGDIGMLNDWEQIAENANQNWAQLWIGHPWIFYRRNDEIIEFSDYTELSLEDAKDIQPLFSVSESELKNNLLFIRKQQNELELKIQKVLNKMQVTHSKTVAKLIMS